MCVMIRLGHRSAEGEWTEGTSIQIRVCSSFLVFLLVPRLACQGDRRKETRATLFSSSRVVRTVMYTDTQVHVYTGIRFRARNCGYDTSLR